MRSFLQAKEPFFLFRSFCVNNRPVSSIYSQRFSLLENMLNSLEKRQPIDRSRESLYILDRAPYLCGLFGEEKRFISVVDVWWKQMLEIYDNGKLMRKPTSVVYHLGRCNKENDGVIMKKLGVSAISTLLNVSSAFDFRELPLVDDLVSYLAGIRYLLRKPGSCEIAYPSLKPTGVDFYENLERYLREKLELKKTLDANKEKDEERWLFTIKEEALSILLFLREMEIPLPVVRQCGDNLLTALCDLTKEGFDYFFLHGDRMKADERETTKFFLWSYADIWIKWRFDPDCFVRDSWSSWYKIYDKRFLNLTESPAARILEHHLNYLNYLPQVALEFGKMDLFRPRFDDWIADLKLSFRSSSERKQSGRAKSLAPMVLRCGELLNAYHLFPDAQLALKLKKSFPLIANYFLIAADSNAMDFLSLAQFLTGLRHFLLFSGSRGSDWNALLNRLPSYLSLYFMNKLEYTMKNRYTPGHWLDDNGDCDASDNVDAIRLATIMLLLRRIQLPMNARLWTNLIALFELGFVERSDRLFEADKRNFCWMLAAFGESCSFFASSSKELKVSNGVWKQYFLGAKRVLEELEPSVDQDQQSINGNKASIDSAHYKYVVKVLLNVATTCGCAKEFESIASIWQRRVGQLDAAISPRQAFFLAKDMAELMNVHRVPLDPELLEMFQRRRPKLEDVKPKVTIKNDSPELTPVFYL